MAVAAGTRSELRRGCRARDADHCRHIGGARLGEEIELGHEVAAEGHVPASKVEPVADDVEIPVTQIESADHIRSSECAGDLDASAEVGVKPAPADDDAAGRGERDVQGGIEWPSPPCGCAALRFALGGKTCRDLFRRIEMTRIGQGTDGAGKAFSYAHGHGIEVDVAADARIARERSGQRKIEIGDGGDKGVGEQFGPLPADANRARKACCRIDPDIARGAERAPIAGGGARFFNRQPILVAGEGDLKIVELNALEEV